jgi:hypothetical protein
MKCVVTSLAIALTLQLTGAADRGSQLRPLPAPGARSDIVELADPEAVKQLIASHLGTPLVILSWSPSEVAQRTMSVLQEVQRKPPAARGRPQG